MRDTRGFTIIELLTVVVIIGLLAAIALPRFTNQRERAMTAAMISDLRNLANAQEDYFAEHLNYTTLLTSLAFNKSPEVFISVPVAATTGWRATATHSGVAAKTCELYFGAAGGGAVVATQEGTVICG